MSHRPGTGNQVPAPFPKAPREQDQGLLHGSGKTESDPRIEVQVEDKDSRAGRTEELEAQRRGLAEDMYDREECLSPRPRSHA